MVQNYLLNLKVKEFVVFSNIEPFKQKLLLEIISLFISKIEDKIDNFDERIKEIVQSPINLGSYELIKTFQYLQSIYCYYSKKGEIVFFPLFYSLDFCKDIKNNLKSDIISIIEILREFYSEDKIFFNNINFKNRVLGFLSEINQLLNKEYSESFCYFSCLENIELEKQIIERR